MKYVKRISLFFVYPACCFIMGVMAGSILWDDMDGDVIINASEVHQDDTQSENVDKEAYQTGTTMNNASRIEEDILQGQYVMNPNALQEMPQTEQMAEETGYFVTLEDDCVVVYHGDRETVFLTTDIRADELPAEVLNDLKAWIYMADEGMLYDFLENYTS